MALTINLDSFCRLINIDVEKFREWFKKNHGKGAGKIQLAEAAWRITFADFVHSRPGGLTDQDRIQWLEGNKDILQGMAFGPRDDEGVRDWVDRMRLIRTRGSSS